MLSFGVLGPLRVQRDGEPVPVTGPKVRALLAALLMRANTPVSLERLTELLWGDDPPETARKSIQVHAVRLRRALGEGVVETQPTGYLLRVRPDRHDLLRFRELTAAARAEPRPDAERELLADALACWRGPVLADVPAEVRNRVDVDQPAEERLRAQERYFEVCLELGRTGEITDELARVTREHPWREAFWALYLEALHRSGRRADALETYREVHRMFTGELGVGPGERLRRAHRAVLADEAPAGPPAVAQPEFRPRQLPPDVATLVGRAALMSTLDETVGRATGSHPPIALLVGPAGVGKTTAAVHWAHRAARRFPDGQLFADLQGYSAVPALAQLEVLTRFSHALGVRPGQVPTELADAAALYRSVLADRRVLIVLDNVAGPDQVRALLPGSPGCAVLITSRDRLCGLATTVDTRLEELAELPPDDSLALLASVVGEERVAAEDTAARELVRLCAGLPLALRIVAANLALWPDRSLHGYLAELAGPDLEQLGVRRAFDLSFDAVSPAAARFFRLLGLVPGADVGVAGAAALAGVAEPHAGRLLWELAASHLVQSRGGGRFGLHDLLRAYAAERAREDFPAAERTAALDRLFGYYLRAAAGAATALYPDLQRLPRAPEGGEAVEPAEARRWLLAEHGNVLAAIRRPAGPEPFAWRAADLLRGFFHSHRLDAEWQAAATAGLAAARRAGDERAAGAMRHSLGALAWSRGDYETALAELEAAQAAYRAAGSREGADSVLHALGVVHLDLGRLDRAIEHFTAALAGTLRSGASIRAANGLINLGAVLIEHGRLAEGVEHNERALELCRRLGSPHAAAIALCNLGYGYRVAGDLARAGTVLTEALEALRELGSRDDEADALVRLAAVHRVTGDLDRAWPAARLAVTVAREAGNQRFEVDALGALGDLHRQAGDPAAALAQYTEAHRLAEKIGYLRGAIATLIGLSTVDPADPAAHAEAALREAEEGGFGLLAEQARTSLARVLLNAGSPETAERLADQAIAGFRASGHRLGEAYAFVVLGNARLSRIGPPAARECWQTAEEILAAAGERPVLAAVRTLLARSDPTGGRE
ncbi:BTAD domain-containing putative transcriptional regulator [Amycolatopsis sp. DG1A-15b]|uniref:AfsR/SARP family transcriptional regulator n=1 Tax=Amycolatopsis sp. DG1A-15b TaxID=3052846 RepID=UPI00255B7A77|nr:BTAD domain-containing putative transcriptional regulator [Amycolatopsis sp. DG1A-15b]WIX89879.1 BTAD domain-containing putative transcriptional regulator [Amycolatopsis sp. DG1A-15b]